MSEDDGFLRRWSRLKHAGGIQPDHPTTRQPTETPDTPTHGQAAIDPATLPPPDRLNAASDYTAFLARGVPAELRRLALRKAWASDPAIANFRGLAEYDWDFNAPGYGQLLPTDNIERLVKAVFGQDRSGQPTTPQPHAMSEAAMPEAKENGAGEVIAETEAETVPVAAVADAAIPAEEPDPLPAAPARRRRHGGAVPV